MTGYQSKKAMAQDKLAQWDNEALKLALEALITITDAIYVNSQQEADAVYKANDAITAIKEALAQPAQKPVGFVDSKLNPIQCPWVAPTNNEWFEWWRVSQVANETEAEIDFADFLIIAQAVSAKLKEKNNG